LLSDPPPFFFFLEAGFFAPLFVQLSCSSAFFFPAAGFRAAVPPPLTFRSLGCLLSLFTPPTFVFLFFYLWRGVSWFSSTLCRPTPLVFTGRGPGSFKSFRGLLELMRNFDPRKVCPEIKGRNSASGNHRVPWARSGRENPALGRPNMEVDPILPGPNPTRHSAC